MALQIRKYATKEGNIVETESDTQKVIELQRRVAELERIIGQKQIEIDFKDKMIDLAEEAYHVDIKKNSAPSHPMVQRPQGRIPILAEYVV